MISCVDGSFAYSQGLMKQSIKVLLFLKFSKIFKGLLLEMKNWFKIVYFPQYAKKRFKKAFKIIFDIYLIFRIYLIFNSKTKKFCEVTFWHFLTLKCQNLTKMSKNVKMSKCFWELPLSIDFGEKREFFLT